MKGKKGTRPEAAQSDEEERRRWRQFLLLLCGQTGSRVGSYLVTFTLRVRVFQATNSLTTYIGLNLLSDLPALAISPLAGYLADKINRKVLIALADVASLASSLWILYLSREGGGNLEVWHIYAVMAWGELCGSLQHPAFQAAVTSLTTAETNAQANSLLELSGGISDLVSPFLAGVLYLRFGLAVVVMIDLATCSFAVVTALCADIPRKAFGHVTPPPPPHAENASLQRAGGETIGGDASAGSNSDFNVEKLTVPATGGDAGDSVSGNFLLEKGQASDLWAGLKFVNSSRLLRHLLFLLIVREFISAFIFNLIPPLVLSSTSLLSPSSSCEVVEGMSNAVGECSADGSGGAGGGERGRSADEDAYAQEVLGIVSSVSGLGLLFGSLLVSVVGVSSLPPLPFGARRRESAGKPLQNQTHEGGGGVGKGGDGGAFGSSNASQEGDTMRMMLVLMVSQGAVMLAAVGSMPPQVVALTGFFYLFIIPFVSACDTELWRSVLEGRKREADPILGRTFAVKKMAGQAAYIFGSGLAGPLTDYVFEPAMSSSQGFLGHTIVGRLVGTGKGKGVHVLLTLMGLISMAVAATALLAMGVSAALGAYEAAPVSCSGDGNAGREVEQQDASTLKERKEK